MLLDELADKRIANVAKNIHSYDIWQLIRKHVHCILINEAIQMSFIVESKVFIST